MAIGRLENDALVMRAPPSYDPVEETSAGGLKLVSGGRARFDVAVIDLKEERVLCRSKGSTAMKDKEAPAAVLPGGCSSST